jgi:hypothetical protein
MRDLPDAPVFTVAEAQAAGWTHSALQNAVRHRRLTRLRRGVYTSCGEQRALVDAVAAARSYSRSVVSHRSAVLLHGLPLIGSQPPVPELTVPPRSNANMHSAHVHRARLRPHDICVVGDTAVTSIARTLIDLARHRALGTAVAATDAALHRGQVSVEQLDDVLLFCWNWPRVGRAQRAVRLSDSRTESPLESVSRLVIRWLNLPTPEPQRTLFDQYGRIVGQPDFYWDDYGVIGEADGRSKYDARRVLVNEKEHQEEFEDLGLVVVRWGWDHAIRRRHVLNARLQNGFQRGQARDRSGFPRLWTL